MVPGGTAVSEGDVRSVLSAPYICHNVSKPKARMPEVAESQQDVAYEAVAFDIDEISG